MHPPPRSSTLFPYTTLFRSIMAKRRGNPNWGKPEPIGPVVPVVTSFEQAVKEFKRCNHGNYRANGLRLSQDRKSTRLNSSHRCISYAVFCLKKKHIGINRLA